MLTTAYKTSSEVDNSNASMLATEAAEFFTGCKRMYYPWTKFRISEAAIRSQSFLGAPSIWPVESAAASPSWLDRGRAFELTEVWPNLFKIIRVFSRRTIYILDGTRRCGRINRNFKLRGVELMRFYCNANAVCEGKAQEHRQCKKELTSKPG